MEDGKKTLLPARSLSLIQPGESQVRALTGMGHAGQGVTTPVQGCFHCLPAEAVGHYASTYIVSVPSFIDA
jgi:hypothetical protein